MFKVLQVLPRYLTNLLHGFYKISNNQRQLLMSRKNSAKLKVYPPSNKSLVDEQIPFYPKYDTHLISKEQLRVTWFENTFSQSKYSFKNTLHGSNACTLITILAASKCNSNEIYIEGPQKPIKPKLIYALAYGMLVGNSIHEFLKRHNALRNYNLTVPEALKYTAKKAVGIREWKSELFSSPLALTLYRHLKRLWKEWHCYCTMKNKNKDLYIILICDSRSVLFIFQHQFDTVTLIDSHQHSEEKGAFIATVNRIKLKVLCKWFVDLIYRCYESYPRIYELALLYFKNKQKTLKNEHKHSVKSFRK